MSALAQLVSRVLRRMYVGMHVGMHVTVSVIRMSFDGSLLAPTYSLDRIARLL